MYFLVCVLSCHFRTAYYKRASSNLALAANCMRTQAELPAQRRALEVGADTIATCPRLVFFVPV